MAYASWSVVFGEQPSAAKWNILGTNDAHFYSFLGDNLAWQTWAPTYSNLSLGNGTLDFAKYTAIGKTVSFRISITIGSSTSITGDIGFSAPVNGYSGVVDGATMSGFARYEDAGTASYAGSVQFSSATIIKFRIPTTNATYAGDTGVNGTVPFAFGSGDRLLASGVYESV